MAEPIGGLAIMLSASNAQLVKDLGKAQRELGKFKGGVGKALDGINASFTNMLKGFAALFAGRELLRFTQEVIDLGDQLSKMSQKTGLSVEFLNGLTQAAALSGVSTEQLQIGLFQLNKNLLDTTRGTGEAKDSFAAMGIGAKDAAALLKNPDEAFLTIADHLANIPDTMIRGAESMRIFGKSGAQLLPFLNQGREAIAAQIKEMQKQRPMTEAQVKAMEAYNDAMQNLTFAFQGLVTKGVTPLLPLLVDLVDAFSSLVAIDLEGFGDRLGTFQSGWGTAFRRLIGGIIIMEAGLYSILRLFEALGNLRAPKFDEKKGLYQLPEFTDEWAARNKQVYDKFWEDIDKKREEEFLLLDRMFPEILGGPDFKPKVFEPPKKLVPKGETTPTVLKDTEASATLASMMALRKQELELKEIEEDRDAILENREAILTKENRLRMIAIAENERDLAIQKEIEAAKKGERAVDPVVADIARLKFRTELVKLAEIEAAQQKKILAAAEELKGVDINHTASQAKRVQLTETEARLSRQQHQLQVALLDPLQDSWSIRGREMQILNTELELLAKQKELYGESLENTRAMEVAQAKLNGKIQEGVSIIQAGLGNKIIAEATAKMVRQLEPFKKAVRDAQLDVDFGEALPGQLKQTNLLRQIELQKALNALLLEEQRLGMRTGEEAQREGMIGEAKLRALQTETQDSFGQGWREAFQQFVGDEKSAFGMGQTVARNFIGNLQSGIGGAVSNIFDHLTEGTLTWRSALETIPDLLKQITSQLIAMMIVRGIASGIAGAFSGGGDTLPAASSSGADFFNQAGTGMASGGSFMVGGRHGRDANFVPLNLTRGERVTVDTPAQQRSGRGEEVTVNVINNAGAEVRQESRETPNGRSMDIFLERKTQQHVTKGPVNRQIAQTFGLPRRGRVG